MALNPRPIVRIYHRLTDQPSPYSDNALHAKKIETLSGATVPVSEPGPYYTILTTHAQPQVRLSSIHATSRLQITSNSTVSGMTIADALRTQPRVGHTQTTSQASANIIAETSPVGVLSLLS